jgi:hypothetical protein
MSNQEESYSIQNIIFLALPVVEKFSLLMILIAGLTRVDVYHLIFLTLFVFFLVFPHKKILLN